MMFFSVVSIFGDASSGITEMDLYVGLYIYIYMCVCVYGAYL